MRAQSYWIIAASLVAAAAAAGDTVARKPILEYYNSHYKAIFADQSTVDFVRPGLTITVNSAAIASNGNITATFTLTDPSGLALDLAGVTTPGPISLSYLAAYIPRGQEQYVSYVTRAATGTVIPTTNQPGADSGGTVTQVGPGQYTYTFKTLATSFDPTVTNTIGIYGSRNLSTFNLPTNYSSTAYDFVPNGSKVVTTRDVIRTASCDSCHDQLSAHGGSRRGMAICVMCHTPQNVDPNTGNSLDLKVMAHKIHMGSSLPSVIAGTPYQIIGFQNSVNDFSAVVDPAMAQRCTVCHSQTTSAAQATAYLTKPTRVTCGSCHDDVNFATGANHPGGAQTTDAQCSTCHVAQGATDFDASIVGAHVVGADSSLLSGLNATITKVSGAAGGKPTVNFTLTNKAGAGVPISALGSLSLTMAGPTTDYGYTIFGSDTTSTPGYVTETATSASCTAAGACAYTFTHAVPAGSTGTYAIGLEARRTETLLSGQPNQQSVTYGATNPVSYFSVDGSPVEARRNVVAISNCNQCHYILSLHGGLRNNNPEYCVMCHNPSNTDAATRVTSTNAIQKALPPQGINFNMLVHRIHFGPNATADGAKNPYVVVGHGGSLSDFSNTLFPPLNPNGSAGDTENCSLCHTSSSEQNLPIGLNPVVDPQGWINPNQATAGACSGCHTSKSEASHFLANTTSLGESCTVCHTSGAAYAVDAVHAQY